MSESDVSRPVSTTSNDKLVNPKDSVSDRFGVCLKKGAQSS